MSGKTSTLCVLSFILITCIVPLKIPFLGFYLNEVLIQTFSYEISAIILLLIPFIYWWSEFSIILEKHESYSMKSFHKKLEACQTKKLSLLCVYNPKEKNKLTIINQGSEVWIKGKILITKKQNEKEERIFSSTFTSIKAGEEQPIECEINSSSLYQYRVLVVTPEGYGLCFPKIEFSFQEAKTSKIRT